MNYQTLGLGLVIAAVAFTGAFAGSKRPAVVERVVEKTFAASPGPDRFNPCESTDGIRSCFTRKPLNTASTTVCSIQAPNATSSLVRGFVKFTTSSTTNLTVTMAKGTLMTATTTILGSQIALGAGAQGVVVASTTGNGMLDPASIFSPDQWFNVSVQGSGGADLLAPVGICQATFEVI